MSNIRWILASTSARRRAILSEDGFRFTCVSPEVQEVREPTRGQLPSWVAETNARLKAEAVARRFHETYVIGADTIVAFGDKIFNKPKDLSEARHMLQALSGQTHQAITAVYIKCIAAQLTHAFSETTQVTFLPLTEAFIEQYLAEVEPLTKAGGYAIQHPLIRPFSRVDGSFTNVMGFPLEAFNLWYKQTFGR